MAHDLLTPAEAEQEQDAIAERYLAQAEARDQAAAALAQAEAELRTAREAARLAAEQAEAEQAALDALIPRWVQDRHRQHAGVFTRASFAACPDPDCQSFRTADVEI